MYIDVLEDMVMTICERIAAEHRPNEVVAYSALVSHSMLGYMLVKTDPKGRRYRDIANEDLLFPAGPQGHVRRPPPRPEGTASGSGVPRQLADAASGARQFGAQWRVRGGRRRDAMGRHRVDGAGHVPASPRCSGAGAKAMACASSRRRASSWRGATGRARSRTRCSRSSASTAAGLSFRLISVWAFRCAATRWASISTAR